MIEILSLLLMIVIGMFVIDLIASIRTWKFILQLRCMRKVEKMRYIVNKDDLPEKNGSGHA